MLALQLVQTLLGLTIQSSAGLGLMIAQIAVLVLTFVIGRPFGKWWAENYGPKDPGLPK